MKTTTKYIETIRKVLPDRTIRLYHTGGFVANFRVTWQEYDEEVKNYLWKNSNSGDKSAPYEEMLSFPGDARDFTVEGRYAIFIKTWRKKTWKQYVLDTNKKITLKGTTMKCRMKVEDT
jgi:thiol-activated cytolysin